MRFTSWDKTFEVAMVEQDEQHQRLFRMINEFADTKDGSDYNELSLVYSVIIDIFTHHIKDEENYFKKNDYLEYLEFKQAYVNLESTAGSIQDKLDCHDVAAHRMADIFLKHMIKVHVSRHQNSTDSAQYAHAVQNYSCC